MAELKIYSLDGKQNGTLKASDAVFGARVNKGLLHLSVLYYLAKRRSGTHSTLTKGEVRGGGKKPYMQKHTGNARRGSQRSPLIVGGGVAFGPKPRSYEFNLTKSMKKAAMRSALTNKVNDVYVVEALDVKEPKTKSVVNILKNFKLTDTVLFIDEKHTENFSRASKNIATIKSINLKDISVYELLKYTKLFITKNAVKKLEENLA